MTYKKTKHLSLGCLFGRTTLRCVKVAKYSPKTETSSEKYVSLKMGRKCIVAGCKSGYASNKERVSLFQLPKDSELRAKWMAVIPETKIQITTAHSICEKHFTAADIKRAFVCEDANGKIIANVAFRCVKLSKTAVPSIFPGGKTVDPAHPVSVSAESGCDNPAVLGTQMPVDSPDRHQYDETKEAVKDIPVDDHRDLERIEIKMDEAVFESNDTDANNGQMFSTLYEDANAIPIPKEAVKEILPDDHRDFEHVDVKMDEAIVESNDSDISNGGLFTTLFEDANAIPIPKGWFRHTSFSVGKWVAFSTFDTKLESAGLQPLPKRSILLTADGVVHTSANGKTISPQSICRSLTNIQALDEMSRLLTTFSAISLCGGVSIAGVSSRQCHEWYQDVFGAWRHNLCSIVTPFQICASCKKLKRTIAQRKRRQASQQSGGQEINSSLRTISPESKITDLRKKVRSQKEVIRRTKERMIKLEEELSQSQNRFRSLNEQSVVDRCRELPNISEAQIMCIREIIAAAGRKSSAGNRYSDDWITLCSFMHTRSPDHYQFLLENKVLPLLAPRTLRRYMSVVNMEGGFDPHLSETQRIQV